MTLGDALKQIRIARNISSKTLSTSLGFHGSYIAKIERGEITPSKDKLQQIFEKLGVPQELAQLLLVDENRFSDTRKELFSSIKPILNTLLVDISTNNQRNNDYQKKETSTELALIMKGGGIKGIAYIGALEELQKFYSFNWYAGTSAGAITAVLLGCGYSVSDLKSILLNKKFSDFKDAKFIMPLRNLFFYSGFYKAESFTNWISDLLAERLKSHSDVMLNELPNRVTIYASKRNSKALVFDSAKQNSNPISASFAARCSMSIPIYFTPQKDQGLNIYDGGLQNNYPVSQLLEDNPDTDFIGLYLGSPIFDRKATKKGVLADLLSIWTEANDVDNLKEYKEQTIIIDPRPISTLSFSLTQKEKQYLLDAGSYAAKQFLNRKGKLTIPEETLEGIKRKLATDKKKIRRRRRIIKVFKYTFKAVACLTIFFISKKLSLHWFYLILILLLLFYFLDILFGLKWKKTSTQPV